MSTSLVKTAVIPVAGKGSRLRPITNVLPKEMFTTTAGPIIELIVRELIESGIEKIIMVTAPGKELIEDHLRSISLPKLASGEDVDINFIMQTDVPGNAGAITSALPYVGDEPFIVVWGDELFIGGNVPRTRQLIDAYDRFQSPVIALTQIEDENVSKCGIAEVESLDESASYRITKLLEKPSMTETTSRFASVGGYVLTPAFAQDLIHTSPSKDGEIYLSTALATYAETNKLIGTLVKANWYETGSLEGYANAFIAVEHMRQNKSL